MQSETTANATAKIPAISYTSWCIFNKHSVNQVKAILHISYCNNRTKSCSAFSPTPLQINVLMHHFHCLLSLFSLRVQNPFLMCIDIYVYPPLHTEGLYSGGSGHCKLTSRRARLDTCTLGSDFVHAGQFSLVYNKTQRFTQD